MHIMRTYDLYNSSPKGRNRFDMFQNIKRAGRRNGGNGSAETDESQVLNGSVQDDKDFLFSLRVMGIKGESL